MHSSKIELRADLHLPISSRSLELLKWIAVLCMLQEHAFRFVVGELPDWSHAVGRLTFPLFAYCFGVGFGHASEEAKERTEKRLWFWSIVAQLLTLCVDGFAYGNVLFLFASAASIDRRCTRISGMILMLVLLLASMFVEFGPLGLAAAFWMIIANRLRDDLVQLLVVSGCLLLIAIINGDEFALWGLPLILVLQSIDVGPPRVPHFFYWVYALQFPVFAAIGVWL